MTDAEVYVVVEPLEDACKPAFAIRKHGMTLLYVDPQAPRLHVLRYLVDELTVEEQDYIREGFGWPWVGAGPVPDEWVDSAEPITAPEELALPTP